MEQLSEGRQFSEQELEWYRAACGPGVLVVLCFGKCQVKQLRARPISFPDQSISHAAGSLVVIARPAAIEIDPEFSLRLNEDALEQIIPKRKRAREARDLAENFGPLPP